MKTLHYSIIVGIPVAMAITVGIILLNHASYQHMCAEGILPNGTTVHVLNIKNSTIVP